MTRKFLTVLNPAAGGGRASKMAKESLEKLRGAGLTMDVHETSSAGAGTAIAREAYARGFRDFLAVGGDGTAYEIVNGLFPGAARGERPRLGFFPLGTGNSFLRDFTERGAEHALQALTEGHTRACDVIRLTHREGALYFINLLSMGFAADVAALTNRRFKNLGELGYLLGVFTCLARLDRRAFPLRADEDAEFDRRRCLFLSFSNSKFTGGKMMIAPLADTNDGLIEYVRWGPIGRLVLIRNLHTLYDGSHIKHPMASRRSVRHVEFDLDGPAEVMVDGEVLTLHCDSLDVLPGALDVYA